MGDSSGLQIPTTFSLDDDDEVAEVHVEKISPSLKPTPLAQEDDLPSEAGDSSAEGGNQDAQYSESKDVTIWEIVMMLRKILLVVVVILGVSVGWLFQHEGHLEEFAWVLSSLCCWGFAFWGVCHYQLLEKQSSAVHPKGWREDSFSRGGDKFR